LYFLSAEKERAPFDLGRFKWVRKPTLLAMYHEKASADVLQTDYLAIGFKQNLTISI
jgi:hypothetical protein